MCSSLTRLRTGVRTYPDYGPLQPLMQPIRPKRLESACWLFFGPKILLCHPHLGLGYLLAD